MPCQLLTGNSIANRFVDTVMQRYNQVVGEACGKYCTFPTNCDSVIRYGGGKPDQQSQEHALLP